MGKTGLFFLIFNNLSRWYYAVEIKSLFLSVTLFFSLFAFSVLLLRASSVHCPVKQKEKLMQQSVARRLSLAQHKHSRHWLGTRCWVTPLEQAAHTPRASHATSAVDKALENVIEGISASLSRLLMAGINPSFFFPQKETHEHVIFDFWKTSARRLFCRGP